MRLQYIVMKGGEEDMSVDKLLKRIFSLRLRSWLTLVALKRKKNHNEN